MYLQSHLLKRELSLPRLFLGYRPQRSEEESPGPFYLGGSVLACCVLRGVLKFYVGDVGK